jgi:hypothetical protein
LFSCYLLRAAINIDFIRQQSNFCTSTSKHGTFWARCRTRGHSTSSQQYPFISPLSFCARTPSSATAATQLPVGLRQLLPPLQVGFSSATWSLQRPPIKAGGDQTALSRPPNTAIPMINNPGAPLEHLASVAVFVRAWVLTKPGRKALEHFFSHMGPGGARPGSAPPCPPPARPRPTAAPGGASAGAGRGGGPRPKGQGAGAGAGLCNALGAWWS